MVAFLLSFQAYAKPIHLRNAVLSTTKASLPDSAKAAGQFSGLLLIQFQQAPHGRTWAFAASFVFRPWFKVVALGSAGLMGIVLLLYGLRALGAVARVLAEQEK